MTDDSQFPPPNPAPEPEPHEIVVATPALSVWPPSTNAASDSEIPSNGPIFGGYGIATATAADPATELPTGKKAKKAPKPTRSTTRIVVEWVSLGVGAAAIAVIIKIFVFQAFVIPSASMYPTLKINDRVLVNKLSYKFNDPERGDIVVFDAPPGEKSDQIQDLVKRVVGLPGEVLQEVNGTVYINNHKLDEPYLKMPHTKNYKACRVPADTYFMMGDNRDQSKDSTYFGPIKSSTIVGRAFIKIWPLNKIEFFSAGPKLEANASGPLDANGVNTATATTNTTTVTTTPPVTTPATAVLQPCGPSNGGG